MTEEQINLIFKHAPVIADQYLRSIYEQLKKDIPDERGNAFYNTLMSTILNLMWAANFVIDCDMLAEGASKEEFKKHAFKGIDLAIREIEKERNKSKH